MLIRGLVVLAVVACVVAVRASREDGRGRGAPVAATQTPWSRLQVGGASSRAAQAAVRERYALWRGRPETMPRALERKALAALGAPGRARLDATQRVRTAMGDVWVATAGAAACVVQGGRGAIMCGSAHEVARRGLMLGVYATDSAGRPIRYLALGIAPDGVRRVPLEVDRVRHDVPVHDNAYVLAASRPVLLAGSVLAGSVR